MGKLSVLKQLEERRRNRVEILKARNDRIRYQASIRRHMDRENMRSERDRLQGIMARGGLLSPELLRARYEHLRESLGESGYA